MNLFNIEAGPWGGLVLLVVIVLSIAAIGFTSWIVSGLLLIVLVVVPLAFVVYFGGRRISRRLVHGSRGRK